MCTSSDAHYGVLAEAAVGMDGGDVAGMLDAGRLAAFEAQFGVPFDPALVRRNPEAMRSLGIDAHELERRWRRGKDFKLAPGTYLAELVPESGAGGGCEGRIFTVNGFYMAMRAEFVSPSAVLAWYVAEFDGRPTGDGGPPSATR